MNRIIITLTSVAAVAVALNSPTTAEAASHGHGSVHHAAVHHVNGYHYGNYHFARYHVRSYRGWSRWYWNTRFGCYYYLSPTDNLWYYYYQPAQCYLPVASIATYPPVAANPPFNPTLPPGQLPSTPPLPPGY